MKHLIHKFNSMDKLVNKSIMYAVFSFIILTLLEFIAYFGFLRNIPGFFAHYAIWFFYLNISVSALGGAIWYIASYRSRVTCMTGMMLGMTVGMQTGMMLGAVVGATNGFFTGAMVGMILGITSGILAGKSCGVMGVMEGMMAGIMGGTMGPMVSLMMFTDHINIFMPFYITANLAILCGLVYMYFTEVVKDNSEVVIEKVDFATLISAIVIITLVLSLIIIYGPKSPLFSFGG